MTDNNDTPRTEEQPAKVEHHTTVIREDTGGGFGMGAILLIAVLILGGLGFWYMSQQSDTNSAIESAAQSVDQAADKVGGAAENVAETIEKTTDQAK